MQALIDRALALNPNFAGGWHARGILMIGRVSPTGLSRISRRPPGSVPTSASATATFS